MSEYIADTDFEPGERVRIYGSQSYVGTFVEYGAPEHACPDSHVSTPGMRIVWVRTTSALAYPYWERDVCSAEPAAAPGAHGRHEWDCACSPELGECAEHSR